MNTHLRVATFLAHIMDTQFKLGSFRFGYASLINVVPGVGDIIDAIVSFYIVWVGYHLRVPSSIVAKMIWNIAVSLLIGAIPIIGDIAYMFRKVNVTNVQLIRKHSQQIAA